MQHFRSALPKGRITEVSYNSLVLDTKSTLRYLVSSLGLEWDDDVLRESGRKATVTYTASLLQVKKPIYRSSIGNWRSYEFQMLPILQELSQYMVTFKRLYHQQLAEIVSNSCRSMKNGVLYCLQCSAKPWYESLLADVHEHETCDRDGGPPRTRDGRILYETNWLLDPGFDYKYKKLDG